MAKLTRGVYDKQMISDEVKKPPSLTILFSGLNISGAIQPSVPIAPVWHVTEFLP